MAPARRGTTPPRSGGIRCASQSYPLPDPLPPHQAGISLPTTTYPGPQGGSRYLRRHTEPSHPTQGPHTLPSAVTGLRRSRGPDQQTRPARTPHGPPQGPDDRPQPSKTRTAPTRSWIPTAPRSHRPHPSRPRGPVPAQQEPGQALASSTRWADASGPAVRTPCQHRATGAVHRPRRAADHASSSDQQSGTRPDPPVPRRRGEWLKGASPHPSRNPAIGTATFYGHQEHPGRHLSFAPHR